MRKPFNRILIFIFLFNGLTNSGIGQENNPPVIPKPVSIVAGEGTFHLDEYLHIVVDNSDETIAHAGAVLENRIQSILGLSEQFIVENTGKRSANTIIFRRADSMESPGQDAYHIKISKNEILIEAETEKGFFHATTTLRQILIFSHIAGNDFIDVPVLEIADHPAYAWRGLMLDVARRYISIDYIKRYIDLLAFYKMNIMHLHLTDDQGWRIQVDRYPKLVGIGSNLKDKEGKLNPGFYTKDDIRDIVAYAADRHITVVPEIEFPGHCVASLNAYPELSCTGGPFEDESNVGALYRDNYCLGNDDVFTFYFNVLDEVFELFPSEYIHIGGDEAPEFVWSKCEKCQARIRNENLQDEDGLQSWAIGKVNAYIRAKGRKMIGWTEIIKGGLAEGVTVQSWTGFDGAITAAEKEQEVIISNGYYFNMLERGANDGLKTVYTSDLLLLGLKEEQRRFVLGGEGCVWEMKEEFIDRKVFPRLLAMAESFWIDQSQKNYPDFYKRIKHHYPVMENWGFQIGLEEPPINWHQSWSDKCDAVTLLLTPGQEDVRIHYTLSGKDPEVTDPLFTDTLRFDESFQFKARAFREERAVGFSRGLHIDRIENHIQQVRTSPAPNPRYTGMAGEKTLIDGFRGSLRFSDRFWQAFLSTDVVIDVDLGEIQEIHKISVGALHDPGPGIFLPKKAAFFVAHSNGDFRKIGEEQITIDASFEKFIKTISLDAPHTKARLVRIKLTSFGDLPEWHQMYGNGGTFIFLDEVWVE